LKNRNFLYHSPQIKFNQGGLTNHRYSDASLISFRCSMMEDTRKNTIQVGSCKFPSNFDVRSLTEFLGSGFCGSVYKYFDDYTQRWLAVKICDMFNNRTGVEYMRMEAKFYEALKDVQGDIIPEFVFSGEVEGVFFVLAVTFVEGSEEDFMLDAIEKQVANLICSILEKIGVDHGNLMAENVIIMPDGKLVLIDFSHSEFIDHSSIQRNLS
jgi:predicted Ser/Thr protein kinase